MSWWEGILIAAGASAVVAGVVIGGIIWYALLVTRSDSDRES